VLNDATCKKQIPFRQIMSCVGLLAVLAILGLWAHWMFLHSVLRHFPGNQFQLFTAVIVPERPPQVRMPFPTDTITELIEVFYLVAGVFMVVAVVLNLMAWRSIKARRVRKLTLVAV
jgi:hypothetical protein